MKNNLKIDEATRNKIKIKTIYMNNKDEPDTVYIKCKTKDNIAQLTWRAKNLPKYDIDDYESPTYPQFFTRDSRMTDRGNIQTNLDLVLRYKYKTDKRPWKDIPPPIIIPKSVAPPQIPLYKPQYRPQIRRQNDYMEQMETEEASSSWMDDKETDDQNMMSSIGGSIMKQLIPETKQNKTKKISYEEISKKQKNLIQPAGITPQPKQTYNSTWPPNSVNKCYTSPK